ncbi:hypothetical protein OG393_21055 [Streptomyces sp. NBC_01216]|uniref:hypothetical protein n=1 Tax=Streptomyces sp. NBC_01216 TaxID=2903778 RepID=UPI002E0EF747|nr:hypothetical protein OG393_21055 [Streptomyces sp. NBC_01216]
MPRLPKVPPILYGAYTLAGLSLLWSAYAITDLMNSGPFGLSVAIAGDIGWITVMWAEHQRRGGRIAIAAGWIIAVGVGFLLVLHGIDKQSVAQAIAGPFVVLVGKTVGSIALIVLRDPSALTPEQEDAINDVIRDGQYQARLNQAQRSIDQQQADAVIERIQQQARITGARDRAHAQMIRDRIELRAELTVSTPLALSPAEPDELPAEPLAHTTEPPTLSPTTGVASSLVNTAEPPAQQPATFGFSAHTSAQSAQRVEAIGKVAELLAQDPGLTAAQVEEALSVSPATAKRYLREARRNT